MTRPLHRWLGLVLALFLSVVALSGAALSVFPATESWTAASTSGLTAAQMVDAVASAHPGLEEIAQSAGGTVTAWYDEAGKTVSAVVDPATGAALAPVTVSPVQQWLENLHRALFLDDTGRLAVAAGAAVILLMSASGLVLLARRSGGWRAAFAAQRGTGVARWHSEVARLAVAGLILSSVTGLWMTAATFDLLPTAAAPVFPTEVSGQTGFDPAALPQLAKLDAADLRDIVLPRAGDATDVITLTTTAGTGYIDQGTGETLSWSDATLLDRATSLIETLHTGRGAALLGLILGLSALSVPFLGLSGALQRRRTSPMPRSIAAGKASTILLVGSEGGSTWGFAGTLAKALTGQGETVHIAPLSDFAPHSWHQAERCLILTATYGNGDAPASARGFLDKLAALDKAPSMPVAVLGFGDRAFPEFCAYAERVARTAEAKGWPQLLPLATVDRQSAQDFAAWGRDLAAATGLDLQLTHEAAPEPTHDLTLTTRRDYGEAIQVRSAILRFALPRRTLWQRLTGRGFPAFQPGDLLGVLPEGSTVPRFYSLASGSRDGFVEICVRHRPGGLCSSQLIDLAPGATIRAFLRPNPAFRPDTADTPVILVGAGTGIGPLAGFIRANRSRRPLHLVFGMRHAEHDFLYREDLAGWQQDGRLHGLSLAQSRGARPHYVQDALRREAAVLRRLIQAGARVMVCGGRDMAAGVRAAVDEVLAPLGLSQAQMSQEGRYAEDVY